MPPAPARLHISDQPLDPRLAKSSPGELLLTPGVGSELHHGFGNCSTNASGLQARFHRDLEGGVVCAWSRTLQQFEGYPGIIHGGILASLIDELMANAVYAAAGYFGVTTRLEVQWLKPVKTGDSVVARAVVTERLSDGRGVCVEAALRRGDGKTAAIARAQFFLPSASQFLNIAGLADMPDEIREAFVPETP